jgi:hypothetical protein
VRVWRQVPFVTAIAAALAIGTPAAQPGRGAAPCAFPASELAWLQSALDGWERVSREDLRVDPSSLPWIVLYDASCTWHLAQDPSSAIESRPIDAQLTFAGKPVPVRAASHNGMFVLPNGSPQSVEPKASTSLYRNGRAAFFAMAMPSVWRSREISAPTRAEFLLGVFSHEMTHIRLMLPINRVVRELARTHDLVYPMNDDVVQAEFGRVSGFESMFGRERDTFYRAALETDPVKRRHLTERALEIVRSRHARYFTGEKEVYARLEGLFLAMEGVGQWAAYRVSLPRVTNPIEVVRLVRDSRRFWSQDEGLALFLLIDAMVPDWRSRVFSDTPASPFALLEEAVMGEGKPVSR